MNKKAYTKSTKVLAEKMNLPSPNSAWPKIILDFKGVDDIPSFESYRDELKEPEIINCNG